MSGAVYTVELDGKIIARRESLLWVRLDAPGLYVVCTEAEDARYIGMAERMSAVESSAKSAHHRIDRLEGREAREDG